MLVLTRVQLTPEPEHLFLVVMATAKQEQKTFEGGYLSLNSLPVTGRIRKSKNEPSQFHRALSFDCSNDFTSGTQFLVPLRSWLCSLSNFRNTAKCLLETVLDVWSTLHGIPNCMRRR